MRQGGFTLVEVLAALVVFSFSIAGLTQVGLQSTRSVTALEDKVLAGIVADSQLVLARSAPLNVGTRKGEMTQMGRGYVFTIETEQTDMPNFFELRVAVRRTKDGQVIAERLAYRQATR